MTIGRWVIAKTGLQSCVVQMGVRGSTARTIDRLDIDNWTETADQPTEATALGNYVRLSNKMTGQEVDQFDKYFIDQDDYQAYMDVCHFRNSFPELVSIKYLNEEHSKQLCAFTYHIKVYIERIPLRLSNITDIPFPENLFLLKEALKGLKILYEKVGGFRISEDMFCMSDEGIVKVWLNPDLSKNFTDTFDGNVGQTQNDMIWDLLEFVDKNTDRETERDRFIDFIQKNLNQSNLNFTKTLNFLDLFVQKCKVQLPKYFPSVVKKIMEERGIYESQIDYESASKFDKSRFRQFNQSKVERVRTNRVNSVNSISESNQTYADRLNNFESAFTHSQAFGRNYTPTDLAKKSQQPFAFEENIKYIDTERSKKSRTIVEAQAQEQITSQFIPLNQQSHSRRISNNSSIIESPLDEQSENSQSFRMACNTGILANQTSLRVIKNQGPPVITFSYGRAEAHHWPQRSQNCSPDNSYYMNDRQSLTSRVSERAFQAGRHENLTQRVSNLAIRPQISEFSNKNSHKQKQQPSVRPAAPSGKKIKQSISSKKPSLKKEESSSSDARTQKKYDIKVSTPKRINRMAPTQQDDRFLKVDDFEFELDPIIAADLARYEAEQKNGFKNSH